MRVFKTKTALLVLRASQAGVVAIEAALLLPVLLLMTLGGLQLTTMYYDYQLVSAASNEAARQAILSSSSPLNSAGIVGVALNYLTANPLISFGSNVPSVSVSLCTLTMSGTFSTPSCSPKAVSITAATLPSYASGVKTSDICPVTKATLPSANMVSVTVSYAYQGPWQSLSWANKTLSATNQYICE